MITANIETAIEAKQKERDQAIKYIDNIDARIEYLKNLKSLYLERESDLYYEIEELKEQLNEL